MLLTYLNSFTEVLMTDQAHVYDEFLVDICQCAECRYQDEQEARSILEPKEVLVADSTQNTTIAAEIPVTIGLDMLEALVAMSKGEAPDIAENILLTIAENAASEARANADRFYDQRPYDGPYEGDPSDLDYRTVDFCDDCGDLSNLKSKTTGKMFHSRGATGRVCPVLFIGDCCSNKEVSDQA
jgi:hypothetical protein